MTADPSATPVACIGLGALGAPMALNLLQAGHPLTVFNRDPDRCAPLVAAGACAAASPAEAAASAALLLVCVSDDRAVEAVLLGTAARSDADSTGRHPAELLAAAQTRAAPTAAARIDSQQTPPKNCPGFRTACTDPGNKTGAGVTEAPAVPAGAAISAAVHGLRPGSLVIDCSTISPATSRRLAAALAERGIRYLDAPVTGGTEGARAGSLSVLVGGEATDLERARPLLEVIGGRITHFGPVGAGQEAKAVNQVLVAGSYAAVAEALHLAERLGLDRRQVVEALKGGAAGSWALEHRSERMIQDNYPLGFRLALHRKDLAIALEAAAAQQLDLPVSQLVAAMEDVLLESGHGDLDVSALARWFRS